ncbi:MAG: hypothetical protein ACKUBY_03495 [Candidatus Moraniibacteriota bacterium]|jgi:hypothetical protein
MKISKQRMVFLEFICKVVGIKAPTTTSYIGSFCITFNSTPEELQEFSSSIEYCVPVPWLDVLFPKMNSDQFEKYDILTSAICSPLRDPIFYTGIDQTTASRPDYGGPRSDPNYRAPYKRKISPIETVSKKVLKVVGKPPKSEVNLTQKRLDDLIQMAINLSEKDGMVNRYLFKKVLGNMIPNTYAIRTSPLKTTLVNKSDSTKTEFPFKERVKFT